MEKKMRTEKKKRKNTDWYRGKMWGKKAEKIMTMTTTQLEAEVEKLYSRPKESLKPKSTKSTWKPAREIELGREHFTVVELPDRIKKVLEHEANAMKWLQTTAKGRSSDAVTLVSFCVN